MIDRRKHTRHSIDLLANYTLAPSFLKRLNSDSAGEGIIKDMSYGGIGLEVCERLIKSMPVMVEFILKSRDIHVSVSGRVIWAKKHNDTTSCGIKLDWISNEDAYSDYMEMLRFANEIY